MNSYDEASPMEIIPFANSWKAALQLHTNLFVFETIKPYTQSFKTELLSMSGSLA